MTIQKLGLALAVSALASTSHAALYVGADDAGNNGGSSLLFAAFDNSTHTSLYVDLNALHANNRVHTFDQNASQSIDLTAVAAANNFSLANVEWTVVAVDNRFAGGDCGSNAFDVSACGKSYMATVSIWDTLPLQASKNFVSSIIEDVDRYWFRNNNIRNVIDSGNGHSSTIVGGYGSFLDGWGAVQMLWDFSGLTGETLVFALAKTTAFQNSYHTVYENLDSTLEYLSGSWTLSESGTLNYAAVPVPAALWLFASGLVGLAGMARRRQSV